MARNLRRSVSRSFGLILPLLFVVGCNEEGLSGLEQDQILAGMFPSTLLYVAIAAAASVAFLRTIRHRSDQHYPSQVRKVTLVCGLAVLVLWEVVFAWKGSSVGGAKVWTGLSLWLSLRHCLLLTLCLVGWYGLTWNFLRVYRWSGRRALWPPVPRQPRSWDEIGDSE